MWNENSFRGHCHHFLFVTIFVYLTWLLAFDMVTGVVVNMVPGAELLKMRVGACWPACWLANLMFAACIICCCCWPCCWEIWFAVIGDNVIVPFWTGALENVTRLLFIVTIVEDWTLLLVFDGYTNLTGSFFGIFDRFRFSGWGWFWPAMKLEKICWWLTLCDRWLKWLLFTVDCTLLFDSADFVKFALLADNEDATRKTEIEINKT